MAIGKIFGYQSDFAFRMIDVAWLTVTFIVTWFIMKPFGQLVAFASCLIFGIIYLEAGPIINFQRDVIAILPVAIALLLVTRSKPNQSVNLIHFLLGVFFALAALIKPHMAIGLPAMILYICIRGTKEPKSVKTFIKPFIIGSIFALVGFLSILVIPFLWLWQIGALEAFWEIFSSYVPLYAQISGDLQVRETFEHIAFTLWRYIDFGGFGFLLMASLFGVYFVLTGSISAAIKKQAILLFSLIVLYSLSAALSGKLWVYHWMPYIYLASLCTAMLLFSPPSFRGLRRLLITPLFVFIVAVMMTVRSPQIAFQQLFSEQQPAPLMDGRVDEIAAYLNVHLSPTDKVQPLDWITGAAYGMLISKAVIATPYIIDFPFYHHVSNDYIKHLRRDFIEKLKKAMPTVIIEVHAKHRISGLDVTYEFPELKEFIKQHYKKDYTGNDFDIFRQNDD
jgi:MFS family permease